MQLFTFFLNFLNFLKKLNFLMQRFIVIFLNKFIDDLMRWSKNFRRFLSRIRKAINNNKYLRNLISWMLGMLFLEIYKQEIFTLFFRILDGALYFMYSNRLNYLILRNKSTVILKPEIKLFPEELEKSAFMRSFDTYNRIKAHENAKIRTDIALKNQKKMNTLLATVKMIYRSYLVHLNKSDVAISPAKNELKDILKDTLKDPKNILKPKNINPEFMGYIIYHGTIYFYYYYKK